MARMYSPYVEVEWAEDRPTVEEFGYLKRLERGEVEAGIQLLVARSGDRLTAGYVRQADLDAWSKWVAGMRAGIQKANAPDAARQIEEALRARFTLPENMRLRVEVVDGPGSVEPIDFDRLLGGVNLGEPPAGADA